MAKPSPAYLTLAIRHRPHPLLKGLRSLPLLLGLILLITGYDATNQAHCAPFDIEVSGTWTPLVDDMDLPGGAGTDLPGILVSDLDEVSIDVSGADDDNDTWRIEIRYDAGPFWHDTLGLEVKRSSNGVGGGTLSGGETFTAINEAGVVVLTGTGNRSDIHLQIRLTGLSVNDILPDTYITQIIYSVEDL